jgi:hypothetical protein
MKRFRNPGHVLHWLQERNEALRIASGKGVMMINDEFAAVVHGEYRRHELLVAVMQQTPKPRRSRGFGSHPVRSLFLRVQRLIGQRRRVALHSARP